MAAEFKKTVVWHEAIKLALKLHGLIDDLPQGEEGLAESLRQASVEIPGQVGVAVVEKKLPSLVPFIGLEAQMEIINRVYPALDTSGVEKAIEAIKSRMQSPEAFAETDAKPDSDL